MTIKRLVAPEEEPISLDEFKRHLKVDVESTDEDEDLKIKLASACSHIERHVCKGRVLITSQWALMLDCWPSKGYIEIPLGNLQSVESVTYRIADGTELEFTAFRLARTYTPSDPQASPALEGDGDNDAYIGRLYVSSGQCWPTDQLDVAEPITIKFTAGWEDAESVPAQLKDAILMMGAHLYRNREAVTIGSRTASVTGGSEAVPMISTPLAMAVDDLCSPYVDRRY